MSAVSPASKPSPLRRIITFPLTLFVIGFICVLAPLAAVVWLIGLTHLTEGEADWWPPFIIVPVLLLSYSLYVRFVERRPVQELALRGALPELGVGYLFGAALFTAVISVLAVLGTFGIVGRHPASVMLAPFFWMIMHAVVEELLFRGLIFRLSEKSLGSVIALIISAAVFGLAHIFNPNADLMSGVAICVEAGILLGVTFMLTRRLWLCFGLHAAWNFVQGGVFSVPISGNESVGLFEGRLTGPAWLSGGAFGAEASVVAVVICFFVALLLYWRVAKQGGVIRPFWRRSTANQVVGNAVPV